MWFLLVQHRTEIKEQADGSIVLGNKLLPSGQLSICAAGIRDIPDTVSLVGKDICYELGDGGTTKSRGIPVHLCVLFTHSHREPGLTYLQTTALEPPLHDVALEALEGYHLIREQGTRRSSLHEAIVNYGPSRLVHALLFGDMVMGASSAHRATCAPVSERHMRCSGWRPRSHTPIWRCQLSFDSISFFIAHSVFSLLHSQFCCFNLVTLTDHCLRYGAHHQKSVNHCQTTTDSDIEGFGCDAAESASQR